MKIDKNATVVDVRTPEEFAGQHYPGAINIPLDEVPQRINEFKKMLKPIILYCAVGGRSGTALTILQQNGVTDAISGGGINDLLQSKTFSHV